MTNQERLVLVDAMRGMAIVLMVIYHFCYDLTYFRLVHFDFYRDPFWLNFRNVIVASFVFVVGISFSLATNNGVNWPSYNRRLIIILACALAISVLTYFMFPGRTIFFGILHFIALASVLALVFRKLFWLNLVIGSIVIFLALNIKSAMFNNDWLVWIGFYTKKPLTEDFAPVFPWFGIVLFGMFTGKFILNHSALVKIAVSKPQLKAFDALTLAGRNSLLIYMVHQPVLMGVLYFVSILK